ncbi:hypothetical protein phytr_11480 [Candidatus Phycorickettsia trachydisci]|uniref:Peptidyl-prolyl cis-trans isomerase plp n=1 Tax=Candidatus Phycorickettsia trachydisci TaxID=2115978 RepID=A0A2P1P9X7_9RICK|nr:SurA N-terminal domain-containing protein [Candidatus Phycorickettsia trachydisci]AVP88073.1 hypothetical protein phytr_11480 [Candidatus Phycorickettsia trachydisci]
MLSNLRKLQDSNATKFIILLIVAAFLGLGLSDLIRGSRNASNSDVVSFKQAPNITRQDVFLKMRFFGVDSNTNPAIMEQIILPDLIKEKLLLSVAKKFGLSFNDHSIAEFIKQNPAFQNENKEFDEAKFKEATHRLGLSQELYLAQIHNLLIQNTLHFCFTSIYVPQILRRGLENFYSTDKNITLVKADASKFKIKSSLKQEEIEEFFDQNKESFTLPEMRDISYVILDKDFIKKHMNDKVKSIEECTQTIEDEIDYSGSLELAAEKFNFKLIKLKNQSLEALSSNKELAPLAEQLFTIDMVDIPEVFKISKDQHIIFSVNKISPSHLPELDIVIEQVKERLHKVKSLEAMEKALSNLKTKQELLRFAKQNKFEIKEEIINIRTELKLPTELATSIINTPKAGTILPPLINGDMGYVAYINSIKPNAKLKEEMQKAIIKEARTSYIGDLLFYLNDINEVKINYADPMLKQ